LGLGSLDDGVTFPVPLDELHHKIDDIYAAFAHRRLSFPFRHCKCCITADQAKHFETTPLRELTSDDLSKATANIPHTAGTVADIYYLVPRILEYAMFERCIIDLSMVFSCLQKSHSELLTAREAAALEAFFETIWRAERNAVVPLGHPLLHHRLVFVTAVLTGNIARYLDLWKGSLALEELGAARNNLFWNSRGAMYRALCDWMQQNMNEDIMAGIEREKQWAARASDILKPFRRDGES
jgi:hypothetical protein